MSTTVIPTRRAVLLGTATLGLLALPGCATVVRWSMIDGIRRLLMISSERALARLTAPGGFWDSQVYRLSLPERMGDRQGSAITRILTSAIFRQRLTRQLNYVAEDAAERAAPVIYDTVRVIGIPEAQAIYAGGPRAATAFLKGAMAGALIEVMLPPLGDALRIADDPLLGDALSALAGADVSGILHDFADRIDETIWRAIADEEEAIRADPRRANDRVIDEVFGLRR